MPSLEHVVRGLRRFHTHEYFDIFADDIDELVSGELKVVSVEPTPRTYIVEAGEQQLRLQLFPEQGVARFCSVDAKDADLLDMKPFVSATLDEVLSAARKAKGNDGLLGDLILAIVVGPATDTDPVERAMTVQFDRDLADWSYYPGPFKTWAKKAMDPALRA